MIKVLVINTKGGCGKTTLAVNLASAFARQDRRTAIADIDRQRSSLEWLSARPSGASVVAGIDWRKEADREVPEGIDRLVVDAPAGLRIKEVEELLSEVDFVVVPVLPSPFDEGSTAKFLTRLDELKPIRKGRKEVLVVANRLRPRTKATQRLETFLADLRHAPIARIKDRSIYAELATRGLALFDERSREAGEITEEWRPLLRAIEG